VVGPGLFKVLALVMQGVGFFLVHAIVEIVLLDGFVIKIV